jgi:riboflavin kinase / FMN adenylyltransferase
MKVFRSVAEAPADFGPSAVAIGNFDGVHLGHRAIMRRLTTEARERGLIPTVLTFDPHPARVLAPERAPKLIMTLGQRLRAFASEGVEAVLCLPFSLEFAQQTPEEFARTILAGRLRARLVMVGEDFKFGRAQSGNIETMRALGAQLGFEVEPIVLLRHGKDRVSSTAIRAMVAQGKVSRACRNLGAPFALEGEVVKGEGIGSKQTVPTVNLAPRNEVLPARGVYVTRTSDPESGRKWPSITNVGVRPTFGGERLTIETFLLSPLEGETPKRIEVQFLRYVREERKFENADALRRQIFRDVAVANRLHARLKRLGVG